MPQSLVFTDHKTQVVHLPLEACFDATVKRVFIRISGKERILTPIENTWDSFFLGNEQVTEDFLSERPVQTESARESF
jgi:antitoxin VapB